MKCLRPSKYVALTAATTLLTVNFWAWSLLSPLAIAYGRELALTPLMISVLVAAPVVVGSLGRIPLGLLADRYGGKKMLAVVCWLAAAAVVWLGTVHTISTLVPAAFALGVAGASFAAGAPFVNAWFPKRQRGLALGLYAIGNAGTALSGLLSPRLAELLGRSGLFWLVAVLLMVAGVMVSVFIQDSPSWRPSSGNGMNQLKRALQWSLTWKLSVLYSLTFGAFVALGMYLPVLLNQSYGLAASDAAARAAGFVLLATLVRPLGGWLSDRLSGLVVVRAVFLGLFILAAVVACKPALTPVGTIAYLGLATLLGIGNGAIFAVIGHRCSSNLFGAVTGVVGAAGGLGGYFPSLIMGLSLQLFHSYSAALMLLAAVCLLIFISMRRLFGFDSRY